MSSLFQKVDWKSCPKLLKGHALLNVGSGSSSGLFGLSWFKADAECDQFRPLMYHLWFFFLQVCSSIPRPLPLLQWLFQTQETGGEDVGGSVDASCPKCCLLLVRLCTTSHRGSVCLSILWRSSQVHSLFTAYLGPHSLLSRKEQFSPSSFPNRNVCTSKTLLPKQWDDIQTKHTWNLEQFESIVGKTKHFNTFSPSKQKNCFTYLLTFL